MRDRATIAGKQADISLLRIAATVGVVLTHTCDATAELHRALLPTGQMVFYRAVARLFWWHVPVFFMITGALFLSRERTLRAADCVMKYARRIVLALVVYGIPFALLELMFDQKTLTRAMVGQAVLNTLNGQNWAHLWYLYSLVGLYLLLPLFKRFTDAASRAEKRYLLSVLFVFTFCFPTIDRVAGTNIGFVSPVTYPVFYLLLGNYLAEKIPGFLRDRKLCACVLCLYALFAPVNHSLNMPGKGLMEYTSPLTAAAACCAFCLFRGVFCSGKMDGDCVEAGQALLRCVSCSPGVYQFCLISSWGCLPPASVFIRLQRRCSLRGLRRSPSLRLGSCP